MFGYLRGKIISIKESEIIIDVGGVGYRVNLVSFGVELGEEAEMFIYTSVSENAIVLYGFKNNQDFEAFEVLLNVSGIGPKKAMGILSKVSSAELIDAISSDDVVALKSAGITGKTAEKIVLELKDKLEKAGIVNKEDQKSGKKISTTTYVDIIEALSTLGYKKTEIDVAIKKTKVTDADDTQKIIKELLNYLRG